MRSYGTTDDPSAIEREMNEAAAAGDYARAQRLKRDLKRAEERAARERTEKTADTERPQRAAATPAAKEARRRTASRSAAERSGRTLTAVAGLSIAIAVGATALGGWRYVTAEKEIDRLESQRVEVVVAKRDLRPGQTVDSSDLEVAGVPAAFVPADAAKKVEDVAGRKSMTTQGEGMPIPMSSIIASASPAGLPSAIEDGKVAYMLSLDPANALSPLLSVGDRVDVLGTEVDGAASKGVTIAEGVRVLALDGSLSGAKDDGYASVTLELTPGQAASAAASPDIRLVALPAAGKGAPDAE